MELYQIYETDFDHSWDPNDVIPTSVIFQNREAAENYVKENGGVIFTVTTRD